MKFTKKQRRKFKDILDTGVWIVRNDIPTVLHSIYAY